MTVVGSLSVVGALAGLVGSLGLVLIWSGLPRRRGLTLESRLEPYLRDMRGPSRLLAAGGRAPGRVGGRVAATIDVLGRSIGALLGDADSVERRQRRAGRPQDVPGFRASQVLWGAAGLGLGMATGSLLWAQGRLAAWSAAFVAVLVAAIGALAADQRLTREVTRREVRLLTEFPTTAELLALSVSAGEGAVAALERICRLSRGELAAELSDCLARARAGASLPAALQGLADGTEVVALRRFVDGLVTALDRGTPLAEVLRAQAQDAREEGRRALMRTGGRREIAMMVPVVFLILPVTILFAVYPAFSFLDLTM
ncbi:MAG TPA: type II secretion system F family protein [Dermatophilaceae bacterium]|nr:type II secretion system F family protein [Dermatophilaceae bacterium]